MPTTRQHVASTKGEDMSGILMENLYYILFLQCLRELCQNSGLYFRSSPNSMPIMFIFWCHFLTIQLIWSMGPTSLDACLCNGCPVFPAALSSWPPWVHRLLREREDCQCLQRTPHPILFLLLTDSHRAAHSASPVFLLAGEEGANQREGNYRNQWEGL